MRRNAIARFLEDLDRGDPVAVGLLIAVAVVGAGLLLFVLFIRRRLQREDEARAKKYGRFVRS